RWWKTTPGILAVTIGLIAIAVTLVVGLRQSSIPDDDTIKSEVSRQGKLGDELSTAQWIFQIWKITKTHEYVQRNYQEKRIIRPKGNNDILIVIDARLKNRLRNTQSPILTERRPGNTSLIENEGRSYPPLDYDARQKVDKIQSYSAAPVLPDAFVDFALVFSVPRGTKPKMLIFTVMNYDSLGRGTDVRVSLG